MSEEENSNNKCKSEEQGKIVFKRKKHKQLRQRIKTEESDEDDTVKQTR